MKIEQLHQFLNSNTRNLWITSPGISVYVRKGRHYLGTDKKISKTLDIANITIKPAGMGKFTRWYPGIRQICIAFDLDAVYFENVLNSRFAMTLEKMGMQSHAILCFFDNLK